MTARLLGAALLAWCWAVPAQAQPATRPAVLGRFLASPAAATATSMTLPDMLAPAIPFTNAPCATARLPGEAAESALVIYADPDACNTPTPLRVLLLGLRLDKTGQAALRQELGHLSAPCFSGLAPSNPRRRAPPRHLTAWKAADRVVTLASDDNDPGLVAAGLLLTQGDRGGNPAVTGATQDFVASLPASCQP